MTIRAFRFQTTTINNAGQFVSGELFDQQTVIDAITDEVVGAQLIEPTTITSASHPDLFAALNALAGKVDDRIQAKRDARRVVGPVVEAIEVDNPR